MQNNEEMIMADLPDQVEIPETEIEKTEKAKIKHRILIIHDNDQDGYCGANIIRQYKKQPTVAVGMFSYDHSYPLNKIAADKEKWDEIFLVDVVPTREWIESILEIGFKLTVIDHHQSTLDAVSEFSHDKFCAYVGTAFSAAGLAWRFCHGEEKELPWIVKMINDWDIWNHADSQVVPFHFGMELIDMADTKVWETLMKGDPAMYSNIMQVGEYIGSHHMSTNNETTKKHGYIIEKDGVRFLCCNGWFTSSYDFVMTFNKEKHDALMWFRYSPNSSGKNWIVSFRTETGVDLLPFAKKYGGGGHTGACGCNMTDEEIKDWMVS